MANGNNRNMGPGQPSPDAQSQAMAVLAAMNASVGRFQGPEQFWIQDVDLNAPFQVNIPRPLNLNRPCEEMIICLQTDLEITVNPFNAANVYPEFPQNLLNGILLNGMHREYGNLTPIRWSGASAFAYQSLFQGYASDVLIVPGTWATPTGPITRASGPASCGRPFVSPYGGGTAGTSVGIMVIYRIPFGPLVGIGQSAKRDLSSYLLQPMDWGDTLQLQLSFGDPSVAGNLGVTNPVLTFDNSTFSIHLNYSILGAFANSLKTGVLIRQEQLLTNFGAMGAEQRIMQLQKQITTNVLVKSGALAQTTPGTTAFASLTDVALNRTQIRIDNKPVRNNQNNFVMKAYLEGMFDSIMPEGYFNLSFVEAQNAQLGYRGDGISGGSLFELWSDINVAAQAYTVMQEMIYGGPFPPLR